MHAQTLVDESPYAVVTASPTVYKGACRTFVCACVCFAPSPHSQTEPFGHLHLPCTTSFAHLAFDNYPSPPQTQVLCMLACPAWRSWWTDSGEWGPSKCFARVYDSVCLSMTYEPGRREQGYGNTPPFIRYFQD